MFCTGRDAASVFQVKNSHPFFQVLEFEKAVSWRGCILREVATNFKNASFVFGKIEVRGDTTAQCLTQAISTPNFGVVNLNFGVVNSNFGVVKYLGKNFGVVTSEWEALMLDIAVLPAPGARAHPA